MKHLIAILIAALVSTISVAQKSEAVMGHIDPSKKVQLVEISCGKCQFHMKGKGCNLALRINGKSYYVDGADIDGFGDAHADAGFCNAIRQAEVQGKVVKNRFLATYIRLLSK